MEKDLLPCRIRNTDPLTPAKTLAYQKGDKKQQYIGGLFKEHSAFSMNQQTQQLSKYSKLVYENTPYNKNRELTAHGEKGNPVPMKIGDSSPIKYVFYIIKENRTYDQVLGI